MNRQQKTELSAAAMREFLINVLKLSPEYADIKIAAMIRNGSLR